MQQPGRQPPPPAAQGATEAPLYRRRPAHPVAGYVWMYGALSGLFAVLQVAVSVSAALESRGAIDSLYYGLNNTGGFNPIMVIDWLAPAVSAAYGTCLLGFAVSMWMCWLAGRDAASAAGRRSVGTEAGLLTSMLSSGIWIAASTAAVLIVHTEGSLSGVLTTTPTLSPALVGPQLGWLLGQEVVAGLLALGFGALAGRIGAGAARVPQPPVRGMPTWPPPPPFMAYPPSFGAPQPPGAAPFVVMRAPPAPPSAPQQSQPWGEPLAWQGPFPAYPPPAPYALDPADWQAGGHTQPASPSAQPLGGPSYGVPAAPQGNPQVQLPANGAIAASNADDEQANGQRAADQRSDG